MRKHRESYRPNCWRKVALEKYFCWTPLGTTFSWCLEDFRWNISLLICWIFSLCWHSIRYNLIFFLIASLEDCTYRSAAWKFWHFCLSQCPELECCKSKFQFCWYCRQGTWHWWFLRRWGRELQYGCWPRGLRSQQWA